MRWSFVRRFLSNRKFIEITVGLCILLGFIGLIAFPAQLAKSAVEGITLCLDVILPTLFPFFVLSTLLIQTGLAGYLGQWLDKWMRPLFNLNGACSMAVALGFIGGYPVGAKTTISLYEKGLCTQTEAERLLAFCCNSGPAFILGAVGVGIFSNSRIGLLLYLAHMAASLTVGFIFRFYKRGQDHDRPLKPPAATLQVVSVTKSFVHAVQSSFTAVMNMCAFVIFFTVAIQVLFLMGILPLLAQGIGVLLSPFGVTPDGALKLLTGIVEITAGLWSLQGSTASLSARVSMAAFMLGWAGISVHCQVLSFIVESNLRTWTYVAGKFLQAGISTGYAYLLTGLFHLRKPVSDYLVKEVDTLSQMDFSHTFSLSIQVTLVILVGFLLLTLLMAGKKHWKKTW